ncbi:mitogen-activated protein kinase kinase kinase 2-like [Physella acuta]|uniref:mitogen-activated protein kinase kinase kinase 2-like n=1 Tax=Physella acuta TaxID=109671 RepID=UPI0027DAEC49|nr:mitogen-activated protein kinase kinase kinase 2-like [Physella acuta]
MTSLRRDFTGEIKRFLLDGITKAAEAEDRIHQTFKLYALLQGLSRYTITEEEWDEIIPIIPRLKTILAHEDPQEQEQATELLKRLSINKDASEQIITDDTFNDILNRLMCSNNKDLSQNAKSVFWRTGRVTGILPSKTDSIFSDDLPKHFEIRSTMIGKGAFGRVFKVVDMDNPDEEKFVAKKIEPTSTETLEICIKETKFLLKAKHERIVQFHGFQKTKDAFYIFLEYLKNGTLEAYISRRGNLSEEVTRHFTVQILEGVDYLHNNNILHRDIKGCNILMADDMNIKLTDFGISEFIDGKGLPTEQGTVRYMAPEVVFTEGNVIKYYTSRSDIWSVGCTVIEMLTGKPPNSSVPTPLAIFRTATKEPLHYQLPPSSSVYLQEFLNKVLHREPKERPTADWLLKNEPFIITVYRSADD